MHSDVFLESHSVYLRPPTIDDIEGGTWHSWFNNQELTKYNIHGVFPVGKEQERQFIADAFSDSSKIILAVVSKDDDSLLGTVSLQAIDTLNRNAEVAIMIGENGHMTAAVESIGLLVTHGFSRLNLHRIYGGTHEELIDLTWVLRSLGFRIEGRHEGAMCRDNVFYDHILFRILRNEYESICAERDSGYLFESSEHLMREVMACAKQGRESSRNSGAHCDVGTASDDV